MKIQFKDLSRWLKTAVVILWILAGLYAISFLIGFTAGFFGYY